VDLPAWGIAVIALYSLLQIPAVLFVARYCEVDAEDLPTPPMRAHWRGGDAEADTTEDLAPETAEPSAETDAPGVAPATDPTSATPPSQDPNDPPRRATKPGVVRCRHCGTTNDPSFGRCRCCVEPL
jgi:hypothetical protein